VDGCCLRSAVPAVGSRVPAQTDVAQEKHKTGGVSQ